MDYESILGMNEAPEEVGSQDTCEHHDLTDTDLSQKKFYEGIKNLVAKSVKRKELRNTIRKFKHKRSKVLSGYIKPRDADGVPKAYSRCSISLFYEVIKKVIICPHKTNLVKEMGFEYMLQLDDCYMPRAFAQWLADNASSEGDAIILHGVSIPITDESVQDTFRIPAGNILVHGDEESGKMGFLALFGLTEVPPTRYFADKIINDELSDVMFKRCFMTVCNATFLCPTSSTKPSTKYMGALVDVDNTNNYNWSKFVCDWLQMFIKKYLKDKLNKNRMTITLGGCIYHLAVRCLDFMDFGLIQLPHVFPRICLWKGDLIKHFSDMLIDKNGKYALSKI